MRSMRWVYTLLTYWFLIGWWRHNCLTWKFTLIWMKCLKKNFEQKPVGMCVSVQKLDILNTTCKKQLT